MGSERMSDDPAKVVAQLKHWAVVVADLLEGRDPTPALEALDGYGDIWGEYLEEQVKLVQGGTLARDRLIGWISHHLIDHHITRLQNMLPALGHIGTHNGAQVTQRIDIQRELSDADHG